MKKIQKGVDIPPNEWYYNHNNHLLGGKTKGEKEMKTYYYEDQYRNKEAITGNSFEDAVLHNIESFALGIKDPVECVVVAEASYCKGALGGVGGIELTLIMSLKMDRGIRKYTVYFPATPDEMPEKIVIIDNKPDSGEKIKAARIASGLTQQAMSDLLEIPKRTIENWEVGKTCPPDYVAKLVIEKLESRNLQ